MDLLKNKKFIIFACAIVFLVLVFFSKYGFGFKKHVENPSLSAGNEYLNSELTLASLVNRDSDLDGVLDWEEGLWGMDPKKSDSDENGVLDKDEIIKLKEEASSQQGESSLYLPEDEENLTETDRFSRELFSTVAALNQAGVVDQSTIDKLSESLVEQMGITASKKIFTIADIKIIDDNSTQAIKKYESALGSLYQQHIIETDVYGILAESLTSEGDIDINALNKLDPIIGHFRGIIKGMVGMSVPRSLSLAHLEVLNDFQKVMENISNIKLVDSDIIIAMSAISQYESADEKLKYSIQGLIDAINQKLSN